MLRRVSIALAATLIFAGTALADPIEGNWTTDSGETAAITGGGPFRITLKTGKHAGKHIGSMSKTGDNKYAGEITDPKDDKTYAGDARLSGNSLKMRGCVAVVFCRTQNWKRQ